MGILNLIAKRIANQHGQAPFAAFRSEAIVDRQIDELIGLIKGVMADGFVNQSEAEFLLSWMQTNRSARELWPASVIYPRIAAMLADSVLDDHEEGELIELLLTTVGGNAPELGEASMSTELPYTKPLSEIVFTSRGFCFTGKFCCGTRSWCESNVSQRGGLIEGINKKLDYLIIGEVGSRDWIHSTHGRKIEHAVELNHNGGRISILPEKHWHSYLGTPAA